MMNQAIKNYLMERAEARFPHKPMEVMENGFHEYIIPTDCGPDEIFFTMYYHLAGEETTRCESIHVVRDIYRQFVWDNDFYRNKIKVYLENDPRNWPDYPKLKVFNIYNGRRGTIYSVGPQIQVEFETPKSVIARCELDSNVVFSGVGELVAYGWRAAEDRYQNRKGEKGTWDFGPESGLECSSERTLGF